MMRRLLVALAVVGVLLGACGGSGAGGAADQTASDPPPTAQSPVVSESLQASEPFAKTGTVSLVYSAEVPGLDSNPLKGFLPFAENAKYLNGSPHSMEWFYLPLRDLMTGENTFNWAAFENQLAAIAARGHQAVFRVYLDYPKRATGIPQYLLDAGLATYPYTEFGNTLSVVPNYKDPRLMTALINFVTALGAKYDGDPRIGFVTAGLYGFWGEWHVYKASLNSDDPLWTMEQSDKDRLLNAYKAAFRRTHVLLRYAHATQDSALKTAFGYHDDSFAYSTLGPQAWHFWMQMKTGGLESQWRTHPIGGEVRPEIQATLWDAWPNNSGGGAQDYERSVRTTHASWMMNAFVFNKSSALTPTQQSNALRAHRLLGYDLHVPAVDLATQQDGLHVSLSMENHGVAPFYYDWTIQLAFADADNHLLGNPIDTDWRLSTVVPGELLRFSYVMPAPPAAARKLLLRVVNPLSNGRPLVFSNQEQGRDLAGWLTLATE